MSNLFGGTNANAIASGGGGGGGLLGAMFPSYAGGGILGGTSGPGLLGGMIPGYTGGGLLGGPSGSGIIGALTGKGQGQPAGGLPNLNTNPNNISPANVNTGPTIDNYLMQPTALPY